MLEARPGIERNQLIDFEKEIGAELPNMYRDFVQVHDGGVPMPNVLLLPDGSLTDIGISEFVSISSSLGTRLSDLEWLFPRESWSTILPVAILEGGGFLVIGMSPERYGEIAEFDGGITRWVADDFRDLLSRVVGVGPYLPGVRRV